MQKFKKVNQQLSHHHNLNQTPTNLTNSLYSLENLDQDENSQKTKRLHKSTANHTDTGSNPSGNTAITWWPWGG